MAKRPGKGRLPKGVYTRGDSDSLWGRVQIDGREYRRSLRTADPEQAKDKLARWSAELQRIADGGAETWRDAVIRWDREVLPTSVKPSVRRRYLASIAMLDAVFGKLKLSQITTRLIADYVSSRSGVVTNATIRRDITALSRLLSACCAWGWIDVNPAKAFDRSVVKEPKRIFEPPSPDELETLLKYAPAGMVPILRALDATGARLDEMAHLQRRAIDWQARTITLTETKTKPRTIDFSTPGGDVTGILAAAVPHVRSPYVFRNRADEPYKQLSTNFQAVMGRAIFEEAAAGRTLRRFRIHDLRHGFAIRWLRRGGSIYDLKDHLGHTTVSTTEIYLRYLTSAEQVVVKSRTKTGTAAL
jgi:integrase/recombinase XerD